MILRNEIAPQVKAFEVQIASEKTATGNRFSEFGEYLSKQREAVEKDVESVRRELEKLQQRNEVTALADKAIADGSVAAYKQLLALTKDGTSAENAAAYAELFRVIHAYSTFAPRKFRGVEFLPFKVNPKIEKQADLETSDLLPLLKIAEPAVRAKAAQLLTDKVKPFSYSAG